MTQIARPPFSKLPLSRTYDAGGLSTQLQNIQRAIPPMKTRTVTSATTVSVTDDTILGDATAGAFPVTLSEAASVSGLTVTIKKIDASANAVTIGGTVDGVLNPTLATQYKAMTVQSDGTTWYKLSSV